MSCFFSWADHLTGIELRDVVKQQRLCFVPIAKTVKGSRFDDDSYILSRLQEVFMLEGGNEYDLVGTVARVLLDAAKADYWYDHEKDYDGDDRGQDCEVSDDDD